MARRAIRDTAPDSLAVASMGPVLGLPPGRYPVRVVFSLCAACPQRIRCAARQRRASVVGLFVRVACARYTRGIDADIDSDPDAEGERNRV